MEDLQVCKSWDCSEVSLAISDIGVPDALAPTNVGQDDAVPTSRTASDRETTGRGAIYPGIGFI